MAASPASPGQRKAPVRAASTRAATSAKVETRAASRDRKAKPAVKAPAKATQKAPAKVVPAKVVPAKATQKAPAKVVPAKVVPAKATQKAPAKVVPAKVVLKGTAAAPAKAPAKGAARVPTKAPAKATHEKVPARAAAKPPAKAAAAPVPAQRKRPGAQAFVPVRPIKLTDADRKFFEEQRKLLQAERDTYMHQAADLQAEAEALVEEVEPGDIQFDDESGEGGTLSVERERDQFLSAQALAAVEEIDAALARIAARTYGVCEHCGHAIPRTRLKAVPFARMCVQCKAGGLSRR